MTADLATEAAKIISPYVLLLITYFVVRRWLQNRDYPPGPTGLPLLGYLTFLRKDVTAVLKDLRKKYGDIFSFNIGPQLIVCISDYNAAKELLNNPLTFARNGDKHPYINLGFAAYAGGAWRENRSFAVRIMSRLGLSGNLYEALIHEDLDGFINEIKSRRGCPVIIEKIFLPWQASKILHLLSGRRLDKKSDAPEIKVVQEGARKVLSRLAGASVLTVLPWLGKLLEFFHVHTHQEFFHNLRKYERIFKQEIENKIQFIGTDARTDFIAHYLDEIEKNHKQSSSHSFTKENLRGNLFLLFFAEVDGIVIFTCWLLLLMAKHQEIQKKVHEEIDSVIGSHGVVSYRDRANLPYTLAVVMEMLRLMSPALFPPRYTLGEIKLKGYTIPKDSYVFCDIRSILQDPQNFDEPMKFMPERFLTENGTKISKPDGYFPFSIGKRKCPGETVAMMGLFIYFAAIMQNFKVTFPLGKTGDFKSQFSVIMVPKLQELCFLER